MTLLTLWSWIFGLQNFEKINFCWFKASSLWPFVTTALIHSTHNESLLATFTLTILSSIASAQTSLLSFTRSKPQHLGWLTDASSQDASPSYASCLLFADSAAAETWDLHHSARATYTNNCTLIIDAAARCPSQHRGLWSPNAQARIPKPCSAIH